MKFIPSHVLFFSKSNSENDTLIFDEVKDKTKLAPFFMAHGVLSESLPKHQEFR